MTNVQPNERYGWVDTNSSPIYTLESMIRQDRTLRMVEMLFLRITPFEDFRVELSAAANYLDLDGNTYTFSSAGSNGLMERVKIQAVLIQQAVSEYIVTSCC